MEVYTYLIQFVTLNSVFSAYKDTKSREQNKINLFIFFAETEYLRSALIAKIRINFEKNTDVDGKLKKNNGTSLPLNREVPSLLR